MSRYFHDIVIAIESIMANQMRSILTALGIIFGVGAVITMLAIGRGLATTPNLHVGRQEGSKAFVQTSTGTIVEIPQPNLPIKNTKSGKLSWKGTCE